MADSALWFKLWGSCLTDPSTSNLSLSDFGAWAKLGVLVKTQGERGELMIVSPAAFTCAMFQVADIETLGVLFQRLPGVSIRVEKCNTTSETVLSVSFRNWNKYQGLLSTPRVQKYRFTKRIEEKRDRREVTTPPLSPRGGTFSMKETLKNHPALKGKM